MLPTIPRGGRTDARFSFLIPFWALGHGFLRVVRFSPKAHPNLPEGRMVSEVKPDGTVAPHNITIVQSLGTGLDEKAIEAVRQWIFKPAFRDGKPVGVAMPVAVQVEFRL